MRTFYKIENNEVVEMTSKQIINELQDSVNYDVYKDGVLYTCFRGKLTPWVEQPKNEDQAIDWIAFDLVQNEASGKYLLSKVDVLEYISDEFNIREFLEAKAYESLSNRDRAEFFLGTSAIVFAKFGDIQFGLLAKTQPIEGFFTEQEFFDSNECELICMKKIKEAIEMANFKVEW